MGGRGKQVSEFRASLVYRVSEFQDSQGYTEKPCLEKPKEKKKDNVIVNLAPNRKWKRQVIKLGSGLKKLGSRDRAL